MLEEIEIKAIEMYNRNMVYLKESHVELFNKIKLFEHALELNYIDERYILEYKEDCFDIYDTNEDILFYNTNSIEYSAELVSLINFNVGENSFKTFYDYKYEELVAEEAKKASILSDSIIGNAPIINYVNQNLPLKEDLKTVYNFIIFGITLGIHIPAIVAKVNAKVYHLIEPSLEIFRLSLFVTDYSNLFKENLVYFYISNEEVEFTEKFKCIFYETFFYNHYIKFFMFNPNCKIYVDYLQNIFVSQTHYIYSYERELKSLTRTYNYLKEKFNYINISKIHNFEFINNKPILILAAGPSLKNNINFLKTNKDKFIIISIYSLLPFLEENNIIPDIVTQYDEQDDIVMQTIKRVNNIDFFKDTIFLFSSHLDEKVIRTFTKSNIYIFQAMFEAKKNFSTLTAPSIGEITYALVNILGGRHIYLLGLDMALDPDTNQTHYDKNYTGNFNPNNSEITVNSYSFRKSIIKVKGNFISEINTLPVYKISIDHINLFTNIYKNSNDKLVYNLSNGAYFEKIQPLKVKNMDTTKFEKLDKYILKEEFKYFFDSISENFFNDIDIKCINEKLEDVKKIRIKLENFKTVKNSNIQNFKNSLHSLHEELCKNYACNDLQKILNNYFNNNIHYIFHLFNIQNLSNPKKHIKELQKIFYIQLNKIIDHYVKIIPSKQ